MLKIKNFRVGILVLVLVLGNLAIYMPKAFAGTLTKTNILELGGAANVNPMIASDGQQLAIDFKTASAGATTASIVFTNGTVQSGAITLNSTGCTTYFPSAVVLPGSPTASGAGSTVSISSITALAATTEYCTILTSNTAYTNPTAGVDTAVVTVGSDSQTAAFDVLASSANAYSITGTVAPTFTMSMGSTDTFPASGVLNPAAVNVSNGNTVTINTNALSGWELYAKDSTGAAAGGLTSVSAGHTISSTLPGAAETLVSTGTENYALGVATDPTAAFTTNGTTTGGGLTGNAFNEIATNAAPANGVTTVLKELAALSGTTPPGADYTDTITVIGTGSF